MKTNHQNETQSTNTITRRSFIKRTTSAALVAMLAIGAFQNEAHAQDPDSDATVDSIMVLTITEDFSAGPFVTLSQDEIPWVNECLTGVLGSKATVTTNTPISGSGASPCFEILSPDPFQYRIVTVDGGTTERWMDLYCGDEITIRIMKANNS